MAQTLDLSTDDKNYSEDQRRLLAQAFRDLGYEVNEYSYFRKSLTVLAGTVIVGLVTSALYDVLKTMASYYRDRLGDVLQQTFLDPSNKESAPHLELEGSDGTTSIAPINVQDMDAAFESMESLAEALKNQGLFGDKPRDLHVYYSDGVYKIYTNQMRNEY